MTDRGHPVRLSAKRENYTGRMSAIRQIGIRDPTDGGPRSEGWESGWIKDSRC
ncbi:MAG: hypothetical protein QOK48_2495 [Blastocatellia bacterium]|nr:hypothetical protein [Blastocatellia bacterium]